MENEAAPGSPITIVIADDHQVVRAALRLLLEAEEGFEVLAEAGDVPTTEHTLNAYRPRVLILDLTMPGESSLRAIPRMRETSPDTQIVVLTMHNDPVFAREALRAGATGYVLKEAADTELVQAVRLVAEAAPTSTRGSEPGSPPSLQRPPGLPTSSASARSRF